MKAIGLRAEKDAVHWALVTGTFNAPILVSHGRMMPPEECHDLIWLAQLRRLVANLFDEHQPDRVGLHLMDTGIEIPRSSKALENLMRRARIEGVLIEAAQNRDTSCLASKTEDASRDPLPRPNRKRFVTLEGECVDWRGLNSWSRRQAIMVAATLLRLQEET